MTTMREIQIEHNYSIGFWDIREGVTFHRVILRRLGCIGNCMGIHNQHR